VPHDVRDQVVDFVRRWSEKTEIGVGRFIHWLGVSASKFYLAAVAVVGLGATILAPKSVNSGSPFRPADLVGVAEQ